MNFDVRIAVGWMFLLIGLLLGFFGYASKDNPALWVPSLGIDVDLWWGLVLAAFGLTMLALGKRAEKQAETALTAPVKGKGRRAR
ncbi:MAG: hypothetical protein P4K86_07765 [Terracidiphilus sp.]|nr:hypothetical protein [Terracidiphilus sp.]MDR3776251.1 hypothetical protein [Terracidiphilus sp.]